MFFWLFVTILGTNSGVNLPRKKKFCNLKRPVIYACCLCPVSCRDQNSACSLISNRLLKVHHSQHYCAAFSTRFTNLRSEFKRPFWTRSQNCER